MKTRCPTGARPKWRATDPRDELISVLLTNAKRLTSPGALAIAHRGIEQLRCRGTKPPLTAQETAAAVALIREGKDATETVMRELITDLEPSIRSTVRHKLKIGDRSPIWEDALQIGRDIASAAIQSEWSPAGGASLATFVANLHSKRIIDLVRDERRHTKGRVSLPEQQSDGADQHPDADLTHHGSGTELGLVSPGIGTDRFKKVRIAEEMTLLGRMDTTELLLADAAESAEDAAADAELRDADKAAALLSILDDSGRPALARDCRKGHSRDIERAAPLLRPLAA